MSKRILTVDGSPSMRHMVTVTLRRAGYEVVEAADGEEALEYARGHSADLVLADVNMPRMNGIPQAGTTGWMVKPFHPDQLLATLDRVLRGSAKMPAQAQGG